MSDAAEENNSFTSDNSFVILGQGSLPSDVNALGDQCTNAGDMQNIHQGTLGDGPLASNQISWGSEPSSIDVQIKLDQLVKENILLKETLNQSNLAMKNQFDTLLLWQQEVMKTHESHKQKFLETQDQISKLRMENMNLRKQVEDKLEGGNDSKRNRNETLFVERTLEPAAGNLKMLLDLTERKCKQLNFTNFELILKVKELETILHDTRREKQALQREFDNHMSACNEILLNEIKNSARANEKGDPNFILINPKEGGRKSDGNCKMPPESHNLMSGADGNAPGIGNFSGNMPNKSHMNAQMPHQRVKMERREFPSDRVSLRRSDYERIIKEYEDLKIEHRFCKRSITEQLEVTRGLSLDLQDMKGQLKMKNREFQEVKNEIQRMMLDCEEVAILRAQVELYQNDFNEERKAREQAVGEKEEMAKQMRFMEKQLNELKLNGQNKSQDTETTNPKEKQEKREENRPYVCPKCCFRFETLKECETHVDSCLDLDMFP